MQDDYFACFILWLGYHCFWYSWHKSEIWWPMHSVGCIGKFYLWISPKDFTYHLYKKMEVSLWSLSYFYISFTLSRCCCRWCRVARRSAELPPEIPRKRSSGKGLLKDESGKGICLIWYCYNLTFNIRNNVFCQQLFSKKWHHSFNICRELHAHG